MKKLGRALRGYSPAAFRQAMTALNDDHRIRMAGLTEQLAAAKAEHGALQENLQRLNRSENEPQPSVLADQKAAMRLLEAHRARTEEVWRLLEDLKASEKEMQERLSHARRNTSYVLEQAERKMRETLDYLAEGKETP